MAEKLTLGKEQCVFGVCSGFAEYLEIDVTVARIIVFAMIFAYPPMILFYFLLAAIMPNPKRGE